MLPPVSWAADSHSHSSHASQFSLTSFCLIRTRKGNTRTGRRSDHVIMATSLLYPALLPTRRMVGTCPDLSPTNPLLVSLLSGSSPASPSLPTCGSNGVANRASWLYLGPVWPLRLRRGGYGTVPVVGGSLARLAVPMSSRVPASPVASLPVQVPCGKCLRA